MTWARAWLHLGPLAMLATIGAARWLCDRFGRSETRDTGNHP